MFKALLSLGAVLTTIRECPNVSGRATVLGFDSEPLNPIAGDDVSLWVAYDLPAPEITGGTATYSFTYNGIPFPATVDPLCDQTACPKQVGFNNESSSSTFPSGISGKIVSSIRWNDQNDDIVWCVETTWKV
jgi:hypothetical protein